MKQFIQTQLAKLDIIKTAAAFTVMTCLVMVVWALIQIKIPPENKEALIHLLGIIEGAMMAVISYYFGSSKKQPKEEPKPPTE